MGRSGAAGAGLAVSWWVVGALCVAAFNGQSVSGEHASLRGTILDSRGQPIGGARVRIETHGCAVPIATATTDSAGAYSFVDLKTGAYDLAIVAGGSGDGAIRDVNIGRDVRLLLPNLKLKPGRGLIADCSTDDRSTTVAPLTQSARGSGLSGRVKDAAGEPVAGASIRLIQPGVGRVGETRTDHLGQFSFLGLAVSNNLMIEANADGFFLEQMTRMVVQAGWITEVPAFRLERCEAGCCQAVYKEVRVLGGCA